MEVKIKNGHIQEEDLNKLHIHPKQSDFINNLANFIYPSTSLHLHAIRGFIFRACRKWQIRNCKPFSSVIDLEKPDMFKFWIQFISLIIEVTKRVIKTENELNFERKLSEAYTMYQTQFSNS